MSPTPVKLPPAVADLGVLAGLMQDAGGGAVTVDPTWFSAPGARLRAAPQRLGSLVDLLTRLLGPGDAVPVDGFPNASWLHLPSLITGAPTPFCVVVPSGAPAAGRLGVGALVTAKSETLVYDCYAYVPLLAYDATGAEPILTSAACEVGLRAAAPATAPFKVPGSGVTFTAVDLAAGIHLGGQPPAFTLTFDGLAGTKQPAVYTTLEAFLEPQVQDWLAEAVVRGSTWLGQPIGQYWVSPGDILVAADFLSKDDDGNYDFSLEAIKGRSPGQLALDFAFGVLYALSDDTPIAIVELPAGGIYAGRRERGDGTLDYGARLALGVEAGGDGGPAVDLALGTWFDGESDEQNWMTLASGSPAARGLALYAVNWASGAVTFAPGFGLTSVGFDLSGSGEAPLLNVGGFTLQGAGLRASLDSAAWDYGFAARLEGIGIPLGPRFTEAQGGGGSNPVARTLLASNDGGATPSSATNPAFSAEAAYVKGMTPLLEILDPSGMRTDVIWFPVQRRLGPLECRKLGVKVDVHDIHDPVLGLIFDGGVSLGPLDVELDQLSISVHLRDAADASAYDLDLQGLAVTFSGGGVEISGGLLKTGTAPNVEYVGEALIKFEDLAISAVGAFGTLPGGGTSLFIFAWLNAPLGGPPFFTVTGLSAGFGYNRALKIPPQDQVQQFPLVAGLANPNLVGGDPADPNAAPDPGKALQSLESWVPVERGEYWLAVGIQATSFEIVNLNLLAIVEFGKDFVIAILGIATLKQPLAGETYVYAELDVEVVFRPTAGSIEASAVLASSSFVLDRAAHLTGGFAFSAWFGENTNAGDWVLTLGGYHPAFDPPPYYPTEPRLGIDWRISDKIAVVGDGYFAITPAAMMAGAGMALTFADGPLKAWLKAQIDAIVFWHPFYVSASASISIGLSFHLKVAFVDVTISVELSADLALWGPPFGFRVHVDWYVISFTITHGDPAPPGLATWDEFKRMLPSKPAAPARAPVMAAALGAADPAPQAAYPAITPVAGLVRKTQVGPIEHWLVAAEQLQLAVGSALPATTVEVVGSDETRTVPAVAAAVRVVGISSANYRSTQTVTILQLASDDVAHIQGCMATASPCTAQPCSDHPFRVAGWDLAPVSKALPKAMYGEPVAGDQPPLDAGEPTVTATVGVTLAPGEGDTSDATPEMNIAKVFEDRAVNPGDPWGLPLSPAAAPVGVPPVPGDTFADIAHVNGTAVAASRNGLLAALGDLGVSSLPSDPLPLMAAAPGRDFADEPLAGSVAA